MFACAAHCQTLEKGLEKYHTLLQERLDLVDEVDGMRKQNQELRNALNQVRAAVVASASCALYFAGSTTALRLTFVLLSACCA